LDVVDALGDGLVALATLHVDLAPLTFGRILRRPQWASVQSDPLGYERDGAYSFSQSGGSIPAGSRSTVTVDHRHADEGSSAGMSFTVDVTDSLGAAARIYSRSS